MGPMGSHGEDAGSSLQGIRTFQPVELKPCMLTTAVTTEGLEQMLVPDVPVAIQAAQQRANEFQVLYDA